MSGESILSEREREILRLVAEGLTNREIAQKLSISHNTVKVHLSNIFGKTGVSSRTEATLYAIEQRIVEVPGDETKHSEDKLSPWNYFHKYPWIVPIGVFLIVVAISILISILNSRPQSPNISPENISRWKELNPMPETRVDMATVVYENKIYSIAGEGPDGVSGSVFRYDIVTDHWERMIDKPTPAKDVSGVIIGEKIYIPGGIGEDGIALDILEIYDPRQNVWTKGPNLPEPISAYALTGFEGKMYLFGGWDGNKESASVWIFDPISDEWYEGASMKVPNYSAKAISLADKVVLFDGRTTDLILDNVWTYFPGRDMNDENPWGEFTQKPVKFDKFDVVNIYDTIYYFGRKYGEDNFNRGSFYKYSDGEWELLSIDENVDIQDVSLLTNDSFIYVVNSTLNLSTSTFWTYQAFYYDIYVPIIGNQSGD